MIYILSQVVTEKVDVYASTCAIARAFPLYTHKSSSSQNRKNVQIEFILVGQGT